MKFSSPAFKGDLLFLSFEYSCFDKTGATVDLSCSTRAGEWLSSNGTNPESLSENWFKDSDDLKFKTVPSLLFAEYRRNLSIDKSRPALTLEQNKKNLINVDLQYCGINVLNVFLTGSWGVNRKTWACIKEKRGKNLFNVIHVC